MRSRPTPVRLCVARWPMPGTTTSARTGMARSRSRRPFIRAQLQVLPQAVGDACGFASSAARNHSGPRRESSTAGKCRLGEPGRPSPTMWVSTSESPGHSVRRQSVEIRRHLLRRSARPRERRFRLTLTQIHRLRDISHKSIPVTSPLDRCASRCCTLLFEPKR